MGVLMSMKLFEKIQHLVNKPPKVEPEIFLSLILDETYIQAAAWMLDKGKKSRILKTTSERAVNPSWEDRIRMADHAIGKLEEETGSTNLSKVVFGLGERFLTKEGDIEKSVRSNLKQLTKSLELTPLGFVPLTTSIAHYLRKTEGIPTSVILIGATEENFDISIYRVGRLAFSISVKRTESEGEDIENALKACTDADVLPSRILLYGADDVRIQESKSILLRHQWTSRANFLHYPKIELFPFDQMINTVVEAGANEITHELIEEGAVESEPSEDRVREAEEDREDTEKSTGTLEEEPKLVGDDGKKVTHMVVVQPETLGFHETVGENELAASHTDTSIENPLEFSEEKPSYVSQSKTSGGREFTSFFSSVLRSIKPLFHSMKRVARRLPVGVIGIGVVLIIFIGVGFWGVTQYLPRVTVTLSVLPKDISRQDSVIIDPQAIIIDTEKKVIPGKKLEKVVSGEKNIPTTGKKKIGDPAKGTVTIFNKSEGTAYSLKKGTIISTGTLQFVLDNDVSLASASTNLSQGQTVFGKITTTATANTVGTEGNIEANREFTLKDYQSSVLVARNDQPFTGGTSKEVTVVSRADYDNLLKSLTSDLIEKAKAELTQSVSGKDRMIDQTVKTAVKEKQYVEEVDQEAKELHGSLTVSVSAYTYNEDDVISLLSAVAQADIPAGYVVNPGRTTVTIGDVTVAKDGKMTAKATLVSSAIPAIDSSSIKKTIAGKKLVDVEKELKNIAGVASAEFVFKSAWKKDTLPIRADNISVTVSPVE